MIDCARPGREEDPNGSSSLLLPSTHLRLRFPFVSRPLRHPTPPAPRLHRKRFHPPAHPGLYCLLPRRILITFAAAAIVSISRRIALIPSTKTLLRRSRTSYAPQFTFDTPRARPTLLSLFFFFFISNLPLASFNLSRFFDRFHFLAK